MQDANPPADFQPQAQAFYQECLEQLQQSKIPFLVAGTYAVMAHTGIEREVKDLDICCRPSDYPRIVSYFQQKGFEVEVEDERWIAKVRRDQWFMDVIFGSTSAVTPVTDQWFEEVCMARVHGREVRILPPTELIWSKLFVQDRFRYDGADIAHVILKQAEAIDWRRLLDYVGAYWEVLLGQLINFRFIYPSERRCLPEWLLDELLVRVRQQADLPDSQTRICRGRHFSRHDYLVDITDWGFADVVGAGDEGHGRKA